MLDKLAKITKVEKSSRFNGFELITHTPLPDLAALKEYRNQLQARVELRRSLLVRVEEELADIEAAIKALEGGLIFMPTAEEEKRLLEWLEYWRLANQQDPSVMWPRALSQPVPMLTPSAPVRDEEKIRTPTVITKTSTTQPTTTTAAPRWQQHLAWFGSPEAYAREIQRKEAAGEPFSDPEAAAEFRRAYPHLFGAQTSTRPSTSAFGTQTPTGSPTPDLAAALKAISQAGTTYDPQIQAALARFQQLLQREPLTSEQIMQMPEYQAMSKAIDFSRGEALAALRSDLAARGLLRPGTTPSLQALEAENIRWEAAKAGQIPQLLQTVASREQQHVGNLAQFLQHLQALQAGEHGRTLAAFGATAPYQYPTVGQTIQQQQWAQQFPYTVVAPVTGYAPDPITGEMKPTMAREQMLQSFAQAAVSQNQQAYEQAFKRAMERWKSLGYVHAQDAVILGWNRGRGTMTQSIGGQWRQTRQSAILCPTSPPRRL